VGAIGGTGYRGRGTGRENRGGNLFADSGVREFAVLYLLERPRASDVFPVPCKLFPVARAVNETELPVLTYSKYAGLKGSGTKVIEAGNLSHSTGDTYFRDRLKTNLQQMSSQLSLMLQVAKVGSEVT